ncbi:MAG: hypothetical protein ABIH83_03610 [Candidatus Micrarchaeota archaeon]
MASEFIEFFGDTPQFRIMNFLFEHRLQDFTKTEIAKGAKISWASLFNYWDELEKNGMVKITRVVGRAKLYQLDESSPLVKQFKKIEMTLIRNAAEAEEEKISVRAKRKSKVA